MLENLGVDDGDIDDREDRDEASKDGPEQKRIAPGMPHPYCEWVLRLRLHAEERPAHMHHLPGEEEREPGKGDEGGGTSTENEFTGLAVCFVTAEAEISVTESPNDDGECSETEGCHPEAVHNHVEQHFLGKDTDT